MSDQPKVSATFKAHGGYDAPWLVVEGNDPGDLAQRLSAIESNGVPALVVGVDSLVKSMFPGQQPVQQSPAPLTQPAVPPTNPYTGGSAVSNSDPWAPAAPAAQAPAAPANGAPGPAPQCNHGARVYKTGNSPKTGNWAAWFCPTPKGAPDQCKAQFVGD